MITTLTLLTKLEECDVVKSYHCSNMKILDSKQYENATILYKNQLFSHSFLAVLVNEMIK